MEKCNNWCIAKALKSDKKKYTENWHNLKVSESFWLTDLFWERMVLHLVSPPTRESINLKKDCFCFTKGAEPAGGLWTCLLPSPHTKLQTAWLHQQVCTNTLWLMHLVFYLCDCTHRQKLNTLHTVDEKKKKEDETLVFKRSWFIFQSAGVRSHHVQKALWLINEQTIKKGKTSSRSARVTWIFYVNGISNEVEPSLEALTDFF